jgi:hypothetical protein
MIFRIFMAFSLFIASVFAARALADDDRFPPITSEAVSSECGECHLVYQPQMLPQRSWRKLLDDRTDHFGEELALDEETAKQVLRYLSDNASDAGGRKKGRKFARGLAPGDTPIRITDTPRWRKKHHELSESVWADPRIGFKGECDVCHTEARRGRYDDDAGLRVPGPNGTWRRWEDD